MKFPKEYLELDTEEAKAKWRRDNTRPEVIQDFVTYTTSRQIFCSDGTKHSVVLGQRRSGVPVFVQQPKEHLEDHQWKYPLVGEPFVAVGNRKALALKTDFITYKRAQQSKTHRVR